MNLKAFFVAALSSALDLGIAVPDDVLRHVTPDVLAAHLPRPLWARLLTACVGAPRVDAQLVVETIGVPNLCEHVPAPILWACIEELALRGLGGIVVAASGQAAASSQPNATAVASRPIPLSTPPPPPAETRPTPSSMPVAVGPNIPAPATGNGDGEARSRLAPSQRFRPSSTGIGRLAANNTRRPQAPVPAAPPPPEPAMDPTGGFAPRPTGEVAGAAPPRLASLDPTGGFAPGPAGEAIGAGIPRLASLDPTGGFAARPAGEAVGPVTPRLASPLDRGAPPQPVKRGQTESDYFDSEPETVVGDSKDDSNHGLAVDDEQLEDWRAADETMTNGGEIGRKR